MQRDNRTVSRPAGPTRDGSLWARPTRPQLRLCVGTEFVNRAMRVPTSPHLASSGILCLTLALYQVQSRAYG
ncbi:hypothetical protein MRX96_005146 [Rhipicephalus microplus]